MKIPNHVGAILYYLTYFNTSLVSTEFLKKLQEKIGFQCCFDFFRTGKIIIVYSTTEPRTNWACNNFIPLETNELERAAVYLKQELNSKGPLLNN